MAAAKAWTHLHDQVLALLLVPYEQTNQHHLGLCTGTVLVSANSCRAEALWCLANLSQCSEMICDDDK